MTGNSPVSGFETPAMGETIGATTKAAPNRLSSTGANDHPLLRTSDRMDIVTPNEAERNTPPPNCPICAEPATLWGRSERGGITTAQYLCESAHGWLTKWVTP